MTSTQKGNLTKRTEIQLDPVHKAWAEAVALRDGRSLSGWVRMIVDRELKDGRFRDHPLGEEEKDLTERTEILFSPDTRVLVEAAAHGSGRSLSAWIRMLVNHELTSKYAQDHPGGDQADPGEQL